MAKDNSSLKGGELVDEILEKASGDNPIYPPGTAHVYREARKLPVCAATDVKDLAIGCAVVAALESRIWPERFTPKPQV